MAKGFNLYHNTQLRKDVGIGKENLDHFRKHNLDLSGPQGSFVSEICGCVPLVFSLIDWPHMSQEINIMDFIGT